MENAGSPRRAGPSHINFVLCGLCVSAFTVSGCRQGGAGGQNGDDNDNTNGPIARESQGLLYLLQPEAISLDDLIEPRFRWLVLEPSRTGSAEDEFSREDIEAVRTQGPCGGKIVLAYLSVGEAEDYRDYWDPAWVDGEDGPPIPGVAPAWLGPSNPNYGSNYKVRYWDPEWQAVILGTPAGADKTPLDRIIDAGFDGVYLDIIDGYLYWSEEGGNELSRAEARRLMIEWVDAIAEYARVTRGAADFLVFPQNAEDIIRNEDYELDELSDAYFEAVSGIGIEDLFYDETAAQPDDEVDYRLEQLVEFRARGKTVLVTDYVVREDLSPASSNARVADFYERTLDEGFIPYAAVEDRDLNEVLTLSSDEWSVSQPPTECVQDD